MGARIITYKREEGIKGKYRNVVISIKCDECGADIPSRFMERCPRCGEKFDEFIDDIQEG